MSSLPTLSRRRFVRVAGRASDQPVVPPARSALAHLFVAPERRPPVAIFGSPVVRCNAAGLARTNPCPRLLNNPRTPVICDKRPRLYRRGGGRACGIQIRSKPQSRQQLPGNARTDRSNRLKAVRVVSPFVFATLLHLHNHEAKGVGDVRISGGEFRNVEC